MAKLVVVDGLARSGTTLITSILHSQEMSACYKGLFHEMLACDIGRWTYDYAVHPIMNKPVTFSNLLVDPNKTKIERFIQSLRHKKSYQFSYPLLVSNTLARISRKEQYDQISQDRWETLLNTTEIDSFDDLDKLYQQLATELSVDVLAFRWNQGLSYIKKWLRTPEHYWISVVRNPMDRALSSNKAFDQTFKESIACTKSYAEKLKETESLKNHYIIYFEDLILQPEEEIKKLYRFLGVEIKSINYALKQQSGKDYRVETSDLISEGKKHIEGKQHQGFDKSMMNKYQKNLDQEVITQFMSVIEQSAILKRYRNAEEVES